MLKKSNFSQLILLNKPFRVMSQFSPAGEKETLKRFIKDLPGFYPAGRLDCDSEGLLLLTNNGKLQHQISHPKFKATKYYWVQVEGIPSDENLGKLREGLELKDGPTLPASAKCIEEPPGLWPRVPPIRERQSIPTQWLEIGLREGRNRQVRRMTAAIGHPTLRLVRHRIGNWSIDDIPVGEFQIVDVEAPKNEIKKQHPRSSNTNRKHYRRR